MATTPPAAPHFDIAPIAGAVVDSVKDVLVHNLPIVSGLIALRVGIWYIEKLLKEQRADDRKHRGSSYDSNSYRTGR